MNGTGSLLHSGKRFSVLTVFLLLLILSLPVIASGANNVKAPSALLEWRDWVMYENEQYACPSLYNDFDAFRCVWPELLNLDFSKDGGTFKQRVTILADTWFYLPGDKTNWPLKVTVDTKEKPVLIREGKPAVKLDAGTFVVAGSFKWVKLPQSFSISKLTGLVSLRVNNKVVNEPFIDRGGKLWIQKKGTESQGAVSKESNIIDTQIFRLLEDTVPLQIKTIIKITVSGESRREALKDCIPENVSTVSVKTPLPVKLIENDTLLVDVRPGKWEISLLSIITDPAYEFKPATAPYGEELWAFKPYPDFRLARIEGGAPVDPAQSNLPAEWKRFSTYLVKKGDVVSIKTIQRGAPDSIADALHLKREIWLDFDGNGATVRDKITGQAGKRQFFSMENGEYKLGRVTMNGEDKLVTQYKGDTGVEIEKGAVDLAAVSRMKKAGLAGIVSLGWKSKFKTAEGLLNLPPGWRLLGLQGGVAGYKSTWVDSWSLLDFFLVLVVSFAVVKLYSRLWGVLFFTGLIFIAHENGAPFYLWLVLTATTAIFRVVHENELKKRAGILYKGIRIFHYAAVLGLAVICFIFVTNQIRVMLYPQLESVRTSRIYKKSIDMDDFAPVQEAAVMPMEKRRMSKSDTPRDMIRQRKSKSSYTEKRQYQLSQQNVATQTGPGIPSWNWRQIHVDFGTVSESHQVRLWLTSPFQNALFSAIRVLLLMLMLYRIANVELTRFFNRKAIKNGGSILGLLLSISLIISVESSTANQLPSPELLAELENRLTKPADCFPRCAGINDAKIVLPEAESIKNKKQFIEIALTVHAAEKTAVPLPSGNGNWQLYDLSLDSKPHLAVLSDGHTLWTYVPKGVHGLTLRGIAYNKRQFQFLFPLKPAYVKVEADGWDISGINENNQVDKVVQANIRQLVKTGLAGEEPAVVDKHLATFLRVRRTFVFGREWNIITTVERFVRSKEQQSVFIDIPLIQAELIRTESSALSVKKGMVTVSMAAQDNKIEWESSIPIIPQIRLAASEDSRLSEVWELRQSSLWHSSFKGVPVVYHEGSPGAFWYPWPGEKLEVNISKLEAAPGNSMTIDSVRADYHVGNGYNRILLKTKIRTTKGRAYEIKSPTNTFVERISVNGMNFPVVGDSETISLPLQPGTQNIEVEWNEAQKWADSLIKNLFIPKKIEFPDIDMGSDLNNIDVYFHLPGKLWLLWTRGPQLGPAVLAWSMIGAVIVISLVLGRLSLSPLSGRQWLILSLGLVSLSLHEMVLVAGWFMVMEIRRHKAVYSPLLFNLYQVLLIFWTAFVVFAGVKAISNGLIGVPDMQISGNNSHAGKLHWTLDHSSGLLPKPWALTYSMYIYQMVMLVWALWFSINSIKWSKWCISSLKSEVFWKKTVIFKKKRKVLNKDNT